MKWALENPELCARLLELLHREAWLALEHEKLTDEKRARERC